MWQYGFILGLWLSLAIICVPWGYIVWEPLLALCSGVEDLIYLSQGLRDHPAGLLYRIMLGSLVLLLRGRGQRWCNMRLHTCQTALGSVIPEEPGAEVPAFKCVPCYASNDRTEINQGIFFVCCRGGCNPQQRSEYAEGESMIYVLKRRCCRGQDMSRAGWIFPVVWDVFEVLLEHESGTALAASPTFWHDEISSFEQKTVELPVGVVTSQKKNKSCSVSRFF